ncbi:MAG: protein kinase [Chloroflexota bacterium]
MIPEYIGQYQIIEEIGRGGMATVYRAHDPRFQRDVAIKVLPSQFTHDPMFLSRFEREARTIAMLEHPAIVPVYDFGKEGEQPFLVMRYMPGGSLADRIKAAGAVPLSEALLIVARLASALDYAHGQGIIHRDLKPGNILFDTQGNPYLADFGIVKLTEATSSFTGSAVLGTPTYMSPEQAQGGRVIDGRSDVYSLGVVLFEMLSGKAPYEADTPVQVLMKHILEPVPHILMVNPELTPAIDEVIARSLAKDADARYATATLMAHALATVIRSDTPIIDLPELVKTSPVVTTTETVQTTGSETNAPTADAPRKRIWAWGVIGALVLIALIGVGRNLFSASPTPIAPTTTTTVTVVAAVSSSTATTTLTPSPQPTATLTHTPQPTTTQTATPPSSPTTTETPLPMLRITAQSTNLRSGPGAIYPSIGILLQGEIVTILARNQDSSWYNIMLADGQTVGWVAASVSDSVAGDSLLNISIALTIPARPTNTPTNTPIPATATPVPAQPNPNPNPNPTTAPATPVPTKTPCSDPYC